MMENSRYTDTDVHNKSNKDKSGSKLYLSDRRFTFSTAIYGHGVTHFFLPKARGPAGPTRPEGPMAPLGPTSPVKAVLGAWAGAAGA